MPSNIEQILFIVPPAVHLLDINGPAHIFYEAREYGLPGKLHFVSINAQEEIKSSAGLHFSKLESFATFSLSANDLIFIPGIEFDLLADQAFMQRQEPFFDWLRLQYANGATICSVCTGAFLLAAAGLLKGKQATTHWKYFAEFKQWHPGINLLDNRLFVEQDRLYTSAGVASGIDLSLYLLEKRYTTQFAIKIAKECVVYFRRKPGDPQLNIFLEYRNHLDTRIHQAQDFLQQQFTHSFIVDDIAQHVNMSKRNLSRLFKKTTGITIGQYVDKLRVDLAIRLLSEGDKVKTTAIACGLKSSNQLRNLLKKYRDLLPTDIWNLS